MSDSKIVQIIWRGIITGVVWLLCLRLMEWIDEQHWKYIHGHFVTLMLVSAWLGETIYKKE